MKKALPPSTLDELRPPNRNYRFFEDQQNNPFKPEATNFELVNAWWLAEAALLAYANENAIDQAFEEAGLKAAGFAVQSLSGLNTQCFVAHNDSFIIVSFRGTEIDNFWGSVLDWATDFRFIPLPDGHGGLVHKGFGDAVSAIWGQLEARLRQIESTSESKRKLWITGHSLGAALATLAADRAMRAGFDVQGLYTYGSPRVGDHGFKQRFSEEALEQRTYRFVNNSDIVARVPPSGLYTHVGTLKYIDNAGHLHSPIDESQVISDVDLLQLSPALLRFRFMGHLVGGVHVILPGFLADHAPVYYAIHIWNNYEGA
jgi:triacylglycerol lipase